MGRRKIEMEYLVDDRVRKVPVSTVSFWLCFFNDALTLAGNLLQTQRRVVQEGRRPFQVVWSRGRGNDCV